LLHAIGWIRADRIIAVIAIAAVMMSVMMVSVMLSTVIIAVIGITALKKMMKKTHDNTS